VTDEFASMLTLLALIADATAANLVSPTYDALVRNCLAEAVGSRCHGSKT